MKKLWLPLSFIALIALLGIGLSLNPREVPSPLIGKPAPAFSAARLSDPSKRLAREDLVGNVWMLNVWASWCAPCKEEHPLLVDFARRAKVPVVGLNYKDKNDAGLAWLKQNGDPYKLSVVDADGRVGIDWGVYGVPETFVVDKNGVVKGNDGITKCRPRVRLNDGTEVPAFPWNQYPYFFKG